MHLTDPGPGYSEPNFEEIMALGRQAGFKDVPLYLMRDLANLASGGDITMSPSGAMESYGLSGLFYHKLLSQVQDSASRVPGSTPLYQAFNLFRLAQEMAPAAMAAIPNFGEDDDDGAQEGNEREDEVPEEENDDDIDNEHSTKIEEIDIDDEVWERISRQLDISELMQSYRRVPFKPDVAGEDVRVRPLDTIDEMNKLVEEEWFDLGTPYFNYRVFTQEAFIRERGFREDQKQLMYLLVDSSGSMSDGNPSRMHKAAGVVYNRLKAVIEEKAVVYIRFFGVVLRGQREVLIDTPIAAKRFLDKAKDQMITCAGGTNISGCLKHAIQNCLSIHENHEDLILPELVLVTDGQDDVGGISATWLTQHDMKLHYFEMIQHGQIFNDTIAGVARDTGGVIASL